MQSKREMKGPITAWCPAEIERFVAEQLPLNLHVSTSGFTLKAPPNHSEKAKLRILNLSNNSFMICGGFTIWHASVPSPCTLYFKANTCLKECGGTLM